MGKEDVGLARSVAQCETALRGSGGSRSEAWIGVVHVLLPRSKETGPPRGSITTSTSPEPEENIKERRQSDGELRTGSR